MYVPQAAILGLNGLKIGEKTLSVRIAVTTTANTNAQVTDQ
jgi:hypothetical protein